MHISLRNVAGWLGGSTGKNVALWCRWLAAGGSVWCVMVWLADQRHDGYACVVTVGTTVAYGQPSAQARVKQQFLGCGF